MSEEEGQWETLDGRPGAAHPKGEAGDPAGRPSNAWSVRMNQTESWGDPWRYEEVETLEASQGMKQAVVVFASPEACLAGSADSTQGLPALVGATPGCASPTLGAEACCEQGSPECPSTTTYAVFQQNQPGMKQQNYLALISSPEDPPAKTSASPDNDADLRPENDPASSSKWPESLTLFDPDGSFGRTFLVRSLARAVGTSEQSLERWPTSGMAWPGGFLTAVSSECRSDAGVCSSSEPSLSGILEPPLSVPARYSLSGRAARGILRRAEKRGKTLPTHLMKALCSVATSEED